MPPFSKILGAGNKKLQKKAEELFLDLGKAFQAASALLHQCAVAWVSGDREKVEKLKDEIVVLERNADQLKDRLIGNIYTKHAYLPQQTQDRYQLLVRLDMIIDFAEEAALLLSLHQVSTPVPEIAQISEKCWKCTDLLQDAVKYIFTDFKKAGELANKIDAVREEARMIQYNLHKRMFKDNKFTPADLVFLRGASKKILNVAIESEITADFIRALVIRYT